MESFKVLECFYQMNNVLLGLNFKHEVSLGVFIQNFNFMANEVNVYILGKIDRAESHSLKLYE